MPIGLRSFNTPQTENFGYFSLEVTRSFSSMAIWQDPYKQTKDEALNHSTCQITLKYIGINKEEKGKILDTFLKIRYRIVTFVFLFSQKTVQDNIEE